jgi:hypothetical protein
MSTKTLDSDGEGGIQWRGVHSAERGELSGEGGTQPNSPRLEEEEDGLKSSFKSLWGGVRAQDFISCCPNQEIGWPVLYKGRQEGRKKGRKEGRQAVRKAGRQEGGKSGRKEGWFQNGRQAGRKAHTIPSSALHIDLRKKGRK